jgi:hypothetical protein
MNQQPDCTSKEKEAKDWEIYFDGTIWFSSEANHNLNKPIKRENHLLDLTK